MAEWAAERSADMAAAQLRASYEIAGRALDRIRYGDESAGEPPAAGARCHDCGVAAGQYHLFAYDVERCPACRGQALTCPCPYPADYPQRHKRHEQPPS